MKTISNTNVIIKSTAVPTNLTLNNCVIDDASDLDLSNGSQIIIKGCTFKRCGQIMMNNTKDVNVTNTYFEQTDIPKEEQIEYMEEWLKEFDEDMYAQWLLWSGR